MVTKKIIVIISLAITIFSVYRIFLVAKDHLSTPFDLGYESPQLCTIRAIQKGHNIYDPDIYNELPFILTMYTPAYHYLVAFLPQHPSNRFFTGRIVSMVFMVLASFCLLFPWRIRQDLTFSILAIGCFFIIHEILSRTLYLRNDSMALFFSGAAIILAERANNKPLRIIFVSLISFIAFTCKQPFLAATASCFLYFLVRNHRDALIFAVSCLFLFVIFGVFAQFYWGEGFWFSVFVAPINPILWDVFIQNWVRVLRQPFFVFLLLLTISTFSYFFPLKKKIEESPYLIYFFLSWLTLALTLGKVGAGANYFFEPILASLLWMVFLVRKNNLGKMKCFPLIILGLLVICIISELKFAERTDYSFTTSENNYHMAEHIRQVKEEIKELMPENGKILNLAFVRLSFELQEMPILNDLILYSVLWRTGILSVNSLINCIVGQQFKIIILAKDPYKKKLLRRPEDFLDRAILAFYQKKKMGRYYYFIPKQL